MNRDDLCPDIMVDEQGFIHHCDGDPGHDDGPHYEYVEGHGIASWGTGNDLTDDEIDSIAAQVGIHSADHRRYMTYHPNWHATPTN